MFLLISIISLVVVPMLVNKTTEHHLDWIKPYLRQAWCAVAFVYVVYFLTTDTAKQLFASWRSGFGNAHPVLAYAIPAFTGGILAPAYWWLMGKLLPRDKTETATKTAAPKATTDADQRQPKLVIKSALYGMGNFNDLDIADRLNARRREGLAFYVDNSLITGLDDPAPNQPPGKKLQVTYLYGGDPNACTAVRNEHEFMVLPEDPKIEQLRREKDDLTRQAMITRVSHFIEDDAEGKRTYPLKIRINFRNDSPFPVSVRISTYRRGEAPIQDPIPTGVLQARFGDKWLPDHHGEHVMAILPGQLFRTWIGFDRARVSKEQIEGMWGNRLGTIVLLVNEQQIDFLI
jgi:hypothetical protein